MADLPAFTVTGDGSYAQIWDQDNVSDATSLWDKVDELIASADDANWIARRWEGSGTGIITAFLLLADMPTDFAELLTLTATIRSMRRSGDDSIGLYAQLYRADETTALSDEVTVSAEAGGGHETNWTNRQVTFTNLADTTDKTIWNGARIRLRWVFSQNMGPDSDITVRVSAIEFNGTYTASGADTTPPTVNVTAGPTPDKISKMTGKDLAALTFAVDEECQAWKAMVVADSADAHDAGSLIKSGGSVVTDLSTDISGAELEAADAGDGVKLVKVFAQDLAGNWSN